MLDSVWFVLLFIILIRTIVLNYILFIFQGICQLVI